MEAAYKPVVNGDLDTQNFEKFDEVSITEGICYLSFFLKFTIVLVIMKIIGIATS